MYQHHSRDLIIGILKSAGRPLYPREVHAQTAMGYPAVRKLLREMLKRYLYQDTKGRYGLLVCLSQTEINAAPRTALYTEMKRVWDRHRHQRHTQPNDVNEVLRHLLKESEASVRKIDVKEIERLQIKAIIARKSK
jgi:hypothetical protein